MGKEKVCLFFSGDDEMLYYALKPIFKENNFYLNCCSDEGDFCVKAHKNPSFCVIVLPELHKIDLIKLKTFVFGIIESNNIQFALIHPKTEKIPEKLNELSKNELLFFSGNEINQTLFDKLTKNQIKQ